MADKGALFEEVLRGEREKKKKLSFLSVVRFQDFQMWFHKFFLNRFLTDLRTDISSPPKLMTYKRCLKAQIQNPNEIHVNPLKKWLMSTRPPYPLFHLHCRTVQTAPEGAVGMKFVCCHSDCSFPCCLTLIW